MKLNARVFDITFTRDDGSQHRSLSVASDHPDLYRLAQEAERNGDTEMVRAIARAAMQDVRIELTVLPSDPEAGDAG